MTSEDYKWMKFPASFRHKQNPQQLQDNKLPSAKGSIQLYKKVECPGSFYTNAEIEKFFNTFDLQGNGYLTLNEVVQLLDCIGGTATERELKEMIHMLDKEGSGKVYIEEFYKMATLQDVSNIAQSTYPSEAIENDFKKLKRVGSTHLSRILDKQMAAEKSGN